MTEFVALLESVGKGDVEKVGGKCANAGEMLKIGIPVPPGFALTTIVYNTFLSQTGAQEEIEAFLNRFSEWPKTLAQCDEVSRALSNIIESKEIPENLVKVICSAYRDLCKRTGVSNLAVAVRSSGIAEDMPSVSFAGQYESYLNVKGEKELLKKVKACWASMFTPRAISYRMHHNMGVLAGAISVMVMKMVNVRSAGVAFTAETVTGDRAKIVVDGNWGAGESVVQGIVNPDHYVIDKETLRIVERQISKKERYYALTEGGTEQKEIDQDKQGIPCISNEEAIKIAELAKRIEECYGQPQDLEWAIDQKLAYPSNVFLVQTRPVTALVEKKSTVEIVLDQMLSRVYHTKFVR